jgi:hypothetical protein
MAVFFRQMDYFSFCEIDGLLLKMK